MRMPHPALFPRLHRAGLCALLTVAAGSALASPDSAEPLGQPSLAVFNRLAGATAAGGEEPKLAGLASGSAAARLDHRASDLVMLALNYIGVQYQHGGHSEEDGFDCSGFTRHVFTRTLGRVLPRRADDQARDPGLVKVRREDLQPGDLVFFNTLKRTFSHVGIYIGEHRFVHAPRPGSQIRTDDMRAAYWSGRYSGARRADDAAGAWSGSGLARPALLARDPSPH